MRQFSQTFLRTFPRSLSQKWLCCLFLSSCLVGCESKAGTGALVGGGIGTAAGVLISPTPAGALIGAGVGAASGALIGAALEDDDRKYIRDTSPETLDRVDQNQQLTLEDIKKMSDLGISDDKIIGTIKSTGSVYDLTASEIQDLKQAGVSQRVIDYMIQTGK